MIRWPQALFYGAPGLLGIALAFRLVPEVGHAVRSLSVNRLSLRGMPVDEVAVRSLLLTLTSLLVYWFAQVVDDWFDQRTDRLNRQVNLFTVEKLSPRFVGSTAAAAGVLAATGAWTMGRLPAFLLMATMLLATAYSVPPVRLKRLPGLSSFTLANCWVLMAAYGFTLAPDGPWAIRFPWGFAAVSLAALGAGICNTGSAPT